MLRFERQGQRVSRKDVRAVMTAMGQSCAKTTADSAVSKANAYGNVGSVLQALADLHAQPLLQHNG